MLVTNVNRTISLYEGIGAPIAEGGLLIYSNCYFDNGAEATRVTRLHMDELLPECAFTTGSTTSCIPIIELSASTTAKACVGVSYKYICQIYNCFLVKV